MAIGRLELTRALRCQYCISHDLHVYFLNNLMSHTMGLVLLVEYFPMSPRKRELSLGGEEIHTGRRQEVDRRDCGCPWELGPGVWADILCDCLG